MRVVLGEDLTLLRDGLTRLLAAYDMEVVAVGDGPGLLHALVTHRPDIAVVDVRLPPTFTNEGLKAAVQARAQVPGLPVLVPPRNMCSRSRSPAEAADTIRDPCWQRPDLTWEHSSDCPRTRDVGDVPDAHLRHPLARWVASARSEPPSEMTVAQHALRNPDRRRERRSAAVPRRAGRTSGRGQGSRPAARRMVLAWARRSAA